jgi:hypothetical protein
MVGDVILWESSEELLVYRDSTLRGTIASAYQTEGDPRNQIKLRGWHTIWGGRDEYFDHLLRTVKLQATGGQFGCQN